ncbi:MAG: TadE/TadG family type IV pilus assembly protein [Clostridiaceae bacterium]
MDRRNIIRNEKGQGLVEFALVLPVLLLILLGIVEFGWLFNAKITMTSAAREAARVYAIKGIPKVGDPDYIKNAVENTISILTSTNTVIDGTLDVDPLPLISLSEGSEIQMATVIVTADIRPLIGFYIVDKNIKLTSQASMRVEYVVETGGS